MEQEDYSAYSSPSLGCRPPRTSQAGPGHSRCAPPPGAASQCRRWASEPSDLAASRARGRVGQHRYLCSSPSGAWASESPEPGADPAHDPVGIAMATEKLPQRVRLRRSSECGDGLPWARRQWARGPKPL